MTPTPAQQAWLNHLTDTLRYRPVRPRTEAEAAVELAKLFRLARLRSIPWKPA